MHLPTRDIPRRCSFPLFFITALVKTDIMRTDLDHLPPAKRRELEHVVHVLFEEFSAAQEKAEGRRTRGRIVKIILYGSHARGGWADEPHTAKGYVSDFDLLVIVNWNPKPDAP